MTPTTTGKPIKCRAAVCWEPGKPMTLETVTIDPPKAGEVRIKMVSAGICASDLGFYLGKFPKIGFPVVLGHEATAIVESVGEGVEEFQPGDAVVPLWNPNCETCDRCKNPDINICKMFLVFAEGKMLDGTTRISKDGQCIRSQTCLSTFSEYSVVYAFCLVKINPAALLQNLAPFGCCVPTGYGAAVNTANVQPNSTAVIWGLGAVGLCVALGCKRAGASRIVGVDINPDKFDIAKKFGCTEFINPLEIDKPIVELIREMTNGGADYTFVSVGNKQVTEDAIDSCHRSGGISVLIGMIGGDGKVGCRPSSLIYGKTWKGSYCGGYKGKVGVPKLVNSYLAGELPETDLLITNVIGLDQIQEGFELLLAGKQIRTVIHF